jgi:hypothetical protein
MVVMKGVEMAEETAVIIVPHSTTRKMLAVRTSVAACARETATTMMSAKMVFFASSERKSRVYQAAVEAQVTKLVSLRICLDRAISGNNNSLSLDFILFHSKRFLHKNALVTWRHFILFDVDTFVCSSRAAVAYSFICQVEFLRRGVCMFCAL